MRNQIVILAAGKGTRMGNSNVPKVLVMLKNKPIILYLLEQVVKINQLLKPIIVVGYMADKVKAVLGDDYKYAFQTQQLGTAHALMAAQNYIEADNVLVLYGDMPLIKSESLQELMRLHHNKKSKVTMFTTTVPNFEGRYKTMEHFARVVRFGVESSLPLVGADIIRQSKREEGRIAKLVEYKDATPQEQQIKELNPGIYMFEKNFLKENLKKIGNNNAQGEYYLTDIIATAISGGINVRSLNIEPDQVIGINSAAELKIAEKLLI